MNPAPAASGTRPAYSRLPSAKVLLWISMVSMIMLFAGLTSAYIVRQAEGNWVRFELPGMFYLSTLLLLAGSATMHYSLVSVKAGRQQGLLAGLLVTLGLGLAFSFSQFLAWTALVSEGIFFVGNPSGSFLYVITALHLAHLAAGLLYLSFVITRAIRLRYSPGYYLQVQLCAIFWHFLDFLWVYLFIFLLVIR